MLHLLKIEWLKVKNYKAFWIFIILYLFAILGINYIGYYINEITVESMPASQVLMGTPYAFPKVWQTVGFMSSWLLYFPGILFIMLLTNEFNFKTHRQNIIDGWTRKDFVTVKFVFAFLFSAAATIFIFLVALLIRDDHNGFSFLLLQELKTSVTYLFKLLPTLHLPCSWLLCSEEVALLLRFSFYTD